MGRRVRPLNPRTSLASALSLAARTGRRDGWWARGAAWGAPPRPAPRAWLRERDGGGPGAVGHGGRARVPRAPIAHAPLPPSHATHPRCRPPAAPPWRQRSGCRRGGRPSQSRPAPAPPERTHSGPPRPRAPPRRTTGPAGRRRRPRHPRRPRPRRRPRRAAGARLRGQGSHGQRPAASTIALLCGVQARCRAAIQPPAVSPCPMPQTLATRAPAARASRRRRCSYSPSCLVARVSTARAMMVSS